MGSLTLKLLKKLNKSGTALPGKIALNMKKDFLDIINNKCDKIIIITGTNGKTTTNNLINHILKNKNNNILSNIKRANMIQGIASTYIQNKKDNYDYGIFEVDEGSLKRVTEYLKPDFIILTNFFRDQLNRYGEIDEIVQEVYDVIELLHDTTLILNTDDPIVNKFTKLKNKKITFGAELDYNQTNTNSLILKDCPICEGNLNYKTHTYGHLGDYYCTKCDFKKQTLNYKIVNIKNKKQHQFITIKNKENEEQTIEFKYGGLYNDYNVCAVYTLCTILNIDEERIIKQIKNFHFSLGRMETIIYKDKLIKIILTKNPIGLSEATTIISKDTQSKNIIHILNDNPADGQDIS